MNTLSLLSGLSNSVNYPGPVVKTSLNFYQHPWLAALTLLWTSELTVLWTSVPCTNWHFYEHQYLERLLISLLVTVASTHSSKKAKPSERLSKKKTSSWPWWKIFILLFSSLPAHSPSTYFSQDVRGLNDCCLSRWSAHLSRVWKFQTASHRVLDFFFWKLSDLSRYWKKCLYTGQC